MSTIEVREVTQATPELVQAIAALLPQLSSSPPPFTMVELSEIVDSPATRLLIAGAGDAVVGTLTLVMFRIPTGLRAMIEDVVVDKAHRGKGIADALTREALDRAKAAGARTVDLTSRPSREAANRLYQKLGFVRRETNAYRYAL